MAEQKYYQNCGASNLPNDLYCTNCGAAFVSAAASPPHTAPSAAPSTLRQQQPYSPSPQPRTLFGLSRKIIAIGVVVIFLLLTLGGVAMLSMPHASPTATPTVNAPAAATSTKTSTATPVPASSNTANGMEFYAAPVANPPQALGSNGSTTPKAGNVYVVFNCTVKNINAPTSSNTRIGMSYWQLRDNEGNVYDPEIFVPGTPGVTTFGSVDSQPGDIVHGYVLFQVLANHGAWESLTYNDGGRNVIISL